MPIPKPKPKEKQGKFMGRCMGSELMQREYPKNIQRLGVCFSQWRRVHGGKPPKKVVEELLRIIEGYLDYHTMRLKETDGYDNFKREEGGKIEGVTAPDTVLVISGHPIGTGKKVWEAVELRFHVKYWTIKEARAWAKEAKVEYVSLRTAGRTLASRRRRIMASNLGVIMKLKNRIERILRKKPKTEICKESIYHFEGMPIQEAFFSLGDALRATVKMKFGRKAWVRDYSNKEVVYYASINDYGVPIEDGKEVFFKVGYKVVKGAIELQGTPEKVTQVVKYEEVSIADFAELMVIEFTLEK